MALEVLSAHERGLRSGLEDSEGSPTEDDGSGVQDPGEAAADSALRLVEVLPLHPLPPGTHT